jgi:hypothetical protein
MKHESHKELILLGMNLLFLVVYIRYNKIHLNPSHSFVPRAKVVKDRRRLGGYLYEH